MTEEDSGENSRVNVNHEESSLVFQSPSKKRASIETESDKFERLIPGNGVRRIACTALLNSKCWLYAIGTVFICISSIAFSHANIIWLQRSQISQRFALVTWISGTPRSAYLDLTGIRINRHLARRCPRLSDKLSIHEAHHTVDYP